MSRIFGDEGDDEDGADRNVHASSRAPNYQVLTRKPGIPTIISTQPLCPLTPQMELSPSRQNIAQICIQLLRPWPQRQTPFRGSGIQLLRRFSRLTWHSDRMISMIRICFEERNTKKKQHMGSNGIKL